MSTPTRREALALAAVAPLAVQATADAPPPPPSRPRSAFITPPPPVDPALALPELAGKARCCVRLHPRPARPGVPAPDASGIGFLPLWPRAQAWPTCPEHRAPLAPVLQLSRDDVPELGFKPHTDLFQLLWCPRDHADAAPRPAVYWRARAGVTAPLPAAPKVEVVDDGYKTQPCAVHPERVFEYPDAWELTDTQRQALERSTDLAAVAERVGRGLPDDGSRPGDGRTLYHRWLGAAPGTKVGGYPDWVQDPAYPRCDYCGGGMTHLLSLASWEWDGGTWPRWMPARHAEQDRFREGKAPGWMFGDAGNFYLFACRGCDGWPVKWVLQSS